MIDIRHSQQSKFDPDPEKTISVPPPIAPLPIDGPLGPGSAVKAREIIPIQLRDDQQTAFSEAAIENFVERMVYHLNTCFPKPCKDIGEEGILELIVTGIDRAAEYGIVNEYDCGLFIDLMLIFGRHFDTNPSYPWAQTILTSDKIESPSDLIQLLYRTATERLEQRQRK